ncbi:FadR/GntR family transcriptional regulator [Isoptericola croceus]|uniref:FadR/GntR family transcriptional regulator n=1 Tax=Isoptericola croceus TaxID=3031406 RepID=UPI0023FA10ED|nr:FadR/GntR family transcriptional regulator [Isoptericola croceus]
MMSDVNPFVPVGIPPSRATPRRRERLAQAVVSSLIDTVVSGAARPGAALPPEPVLADSFGVSRSTVREAVKLLEAKGLVEVRHGLGSVVRPEGDWNLLEPDVLAAAVRYERGLAVLDELVRVRAALESMLVVQAAVHASDDDLAEIAALQAQMAAEIATPRAFIDSDVLFHDRIMRAAGSRLARSIVRTVHTEARTSALYSGSPTPEACRISNDEHAEILARLVARDPGGAADALGGHITRAWERRRPA